MRDGLVGRSDVRAMLNRWGYPDSAPRMYGRRIEPNDPSRGLGPPCSSCRNRGLVRLESSVTPRLPIYACTSCGGFSYFTAARGSERCNPTPAELEQLRARYAKVEHDGGSTAGLVKPWEGSNE